MNCKIKGCQENVGVFYPYCCKHHYARQEQDELNKKAEEGNEDDI